MKNNIILFTLTFISFFAFGQKPKVKPVETTKPFVLGVIALRISSIEILKSS